MRALVLAIVIAGLALPASALAQQEDNPDYTVIPGPGSSSKGTGYFVIDARPGQTIKQSLALRNDEDVAIEVSLAAVDAKTGALGGVSYGLETEPKRRVGSWIKLTSNKVRLAPGASKVVRFTVAVPRDARPGVNLGGISVFIPRTEQGGAGQRQGGQAGASVVVRTRRILAVQVNLPGGQRPRLVVDGVEPAARPDGLYLEIDIANEGTGLTKGTGVVSVPAEDFEAEFAIDTFVPGTSIAYPVKWADAADNGEYEASVRIEYEGGEATSWDGTFTLGEDVQAELADRQVTPPEDVGEDSPSSPGGLIALIVAAVLLGMAATYFLMKRKPGGAQGPPTT